MSAKPTVTYTFSKDKFVGAMKTALDAGALNAARTGAEFIRSKVGTKHGGTASKGWGPWNTQTGNARGSIAAVKTGDGKAAFGSNVKYVRYLEFGATIKPKTAKALLVPVGIGKKLFRGRNPKDVIAAGKADGTIFTKKTKEGKRVIFLKTGKTDRSAKPIAVLRKQVTLYPRPMFRPAMANKELLSKMEERFVDAGIKAIKNFKAQPASTEGGATV